MLPRLTSLVCLLLGLLCACDSDQRLEKVSELTDQKIENYIEAYTTLKEHMPNQLHKVNETGTSPKDDFEDFERMVKEAGFSDYDEFARLNIRIGGIFTAIQANESESSFLSAQGKILRQGEDWRQVIAQKVESITGEEVLPSEIELVRLRKEKLFELYAGFPPPGYELSS